MFMVSWVKAYIKTYQTSINCMPNILQVNILKNKMSFTGAYYSEYEKPFKMKRGKVTFKIKE